MYLNIRALLDNMYLIDGGYTEWTIFSPCTAKCDGDQGNRVRRRFCANPEPQFGGSNCDELGPNREAIVCFGETPFQTTSPEEDCFNI